MGAVRVFTTVRRSLQPWLRSQGRGSLLLRVCAWKKQLASTAQKTELRGTAVMQVTALQSSREGQRESGLPEGSRLPH